MDPVTLLDYSQRQGTQTSANYQVPTTVDGADLTSVAFGVDLSLTDITDDSLSFAVHVTRSSDGGQTWVSGGQFNWAGHPLNEIPSAGVILGDNSWGGQLIRLEASIPVQMLFGASCTPLST